MEKPHWDNHRTKWWIFQRVRLNWYTKMPNNSMFCSCAKNNWHSFRYVFLEKMWRRSGVVTLSQKKDWMKPENRRGSWCAHWVTMVILGFNELVSLRQWIATAKRWTSGMYNIMSVAADLMAPVWLSQSWSYWAAFSSMASRIWSLLYSIASWQRNRPRKNHGKDLNPAGEELSIWVCLARAPRNSKDSHRFFPYIINCHFRAYSVFPVLRHSHLKGDNMYNMREGRRRSSGINLGDR